MKKVLAFILTAALLAGLTGCGGGGEPMPVEMAGPTPVETMEPTPVATVEPTPAEERTAIDDGRARPSNAGRLQVKNGKLSDEEGLPVMLRGVSFNGLITSESFLNEQLFQELSRDDGVNLVRLAMYTYGMGIVGYCTKGDKDRHKADIHKGVELAKANDMYVLVDWHILSDGDPNTYIDDARTFFVEMAEKYSGYDNVIYEICNEPNGVDWAAVKRYAEAIIPIIREKDPRALIVVGNPDWSKDLYSVAADPLDYDNILYTLHFYAATHGQDFRDMTEELSQQGLPIFVTEYGVTAASGGTPRDLDSADLWIDLLERENISHCLWAFAKVPEACSTVRFNVPKYSGFVKEDYTETGLWLLDTLAKHTSR